MGKNKDKQFNLSKRKILLNLILENYSEKDIAMILKVHPSTISRELKNYRYLEFKAGNNSSICFSCSESFKCKKRRVCGSILCTKQCIGCTTLQKCEFFKPLQCKIENKFPFICKKCIHISECKRNHYQYNPEKANEQALKIRSESRMGIDLSSEQFERINLIIKQGNQNGQAIYHIVNANKDEIPKTVKTVYNYINKGLLDTKRHNLPRAVYLKQRKKKMSNKYQYDENKNIDRNNRTYVDWLKYQAKNRVIIYWQMDFLGAPKNSDQEILVLTCSHLKFSFIFSIYRPTQEKVVKIFDMLEELLGDDFKKIFEVILTDRDSKFNKFTNLEVNKYGEIRTHVFFCNPGKSNDKPNVENFNGQLRSIFPKKENIKNLTFEQNMLICSHLNSRFLNSLDGKTPIDLFKEVFSETVLNKLGIKRIPPKEVKILNFKKY